MTSPLKSPKPPFVFEATHAARAAASAYKDKTKKERLRLYFVFVEDDATDLAQQTDFSDLAALLAKHRALGSFQAKVGETLLLLEAGLLLVGMGKMQEWHPERAAEAFRSLGNRLAQFKKLSLSVIVHANLTRALGIHKQSHQDLQTQLTLGLTAKARAHKKTDADASSGNNIWPDYAAACELDDLLTQLVVCLNIGANTAVKTIKNKSSRSKRDNSNTKKDSTKQENILIQMDTTMLPGAISQTKLRATLQKAQHTAAMLEGARYVASLPGNHFNPEHYEKYARNLAREYRLKIEVFQQKKLEQMGCGGILAVGQGSAVPPRMIVLEYKPKRSRIPRPLLLIGKGITFDTGGISLKPSAEMHEMKYDMCGSALALHGIALAAAQQLGLGVVAILGIAENMPDGLAIKPGDVYTAYNGLSV